MAVPKRKTSKTRRNKRRSHDALRAPGYSVCPKCNETSRAHHVCENCGTYSGRQLISVKE
ncbi:MAG: 50S ribosomal protein L32 [Candidatus Cloacimonetes bacterium]|nr:50S ribosomal protein L32 [Candidatus Cloacimonadota bacterium]